MCLLHFRTRPAGVSTNEEILLRVLPALAGETVSGASVLLGSDSSTSYGGSVKTRPSSAARPSLPYRTSKLFLASLFQGAATGMNDSSENVGQDGILSHAFSSFPGEFCELVYDSSRIEDRELNTQILDPRFSIFDPRSSILDPRSSILTHTLAPPSDPPSPLAAPESNRPRAQLSQATARWPQRLPGR